jgi:adenine specific DNA methylase Mod
LTRETNRRHCGGPASAIAELIRVCSRFESSSFCQGEKFLTPRRAGFECADSWGRILANESGGKNANKLFYGDNLNVLRNEVASESIDLIYLDPPFNSQATYNVLFKAPSGARSQAQIEAFEDTWHWNESAELAFDEVMQGPESDAAIMLRAMRVALGENDMMAYLAMMAVRLTELHRVLKPTGSLFLHCDPTASHYLKILLDGIFGPTNFQNEITWKRRVGFDLSP